MATEKEWNDAMEHLKEFIQNYDALGINISGNEYEFFNDMLSSLSDTINEHSWSDLQDYIEVCDTFNENPTPHNSGDA